MHKSPSDEPGEPGPSGTRRQPDRCRDLTREMVFPVCESREDGLVELVQGWRADLDARNCHAEPAGDLLEHGQRQAGFAARGVHALHATAPLLDQSEFVEHPADDAVAELRDPTLKTLDGEPEGK